MPPASPVVQENTETLLCSEAPEMFVEAETSPDFSLACGLVDND